MGRNHKKRTHQDFSDRAAGKEQSYGVGGALHEVKKRRLSSESTEITGKSSAMIPEAAQDGTVESRQSDGAGDDGWQTVAHKSKKRDAEGKKTKYPELIFHCKKQDSIRIADLQQLVLYTFADGVAPTWVAFQNYGHVRKIVVLMVPGLEREMFDGTSDLFSDGSGEHLDASKPAGDTNQPVSEGTSDQVTDTEQRKREDFVAWKAGAQSSKPRSNDAAPIDISASALPPCLKPMADVFNQVWPVKAPGDSKYAKIHSPLQAMLIAPLPKGPPDKNNKQDQQGNHGYESIRTPISHLVHSADELREAEYPIHPAAFSSTEDSDLEKARRIATNQSPASGWVDSNVTSPTPINRPDRGGLSLRQGFDVYAIDCEMVLTTDDVYSLARVSIVDWSGSTILDSYVLPSLPVKNYFTQYSGITPAHLSNITTTIQDIQSRLLTLCTPSTILLGHSLESDLLALKFTHPHIIDTSLIYPHPRGPPLRSSLKYLTTKYLKREIQSAGANGHNSVEDALAVLDLVKLKCEKGPKFGTFESSGESIFRKLVRPRGGKPGRTSAIVDFGTPERGFGKDATHAIGCVDDEGVVAGIARAVNGDPNGETIKAGGVDFVWGRMRELEAFRGWANNNREYGTVDELHAREPADDDDTASPLPTLESRLHRTTSQIRSLASSLPPCTLLIVYSGTGSPHEASRLQRMQATYRKEFKVKKWDDLSVKWTDVEEQALRRAVEKARRGCGFLRVV